MSACTSPWFRGLTCDHLFADCPNMRRGEAELRRYGWWDGDSDGDGARDGERIDPHAEYEGWGVCGLCLHRHNRIEHREAS